MIDPPRWDRQAFETERLKAITIFRDERTREPLLDYLAAFDAYRSYIEELLERTADLSELDRAALDVLTHPHLLTAFRYLAAPPISSDDLKVLSEVTSLTRSRLRDRPEDSGRLIATVRSVMDRRRFAWLEQSRKPTESEREAAVVATAALIAVSHVQTKRRNTGKKQQETFVLDKLAELGLTRVGTRGIPTLSRAPEPGQFCAESVLGARKADVIVRLWDERVMPIECKVSNSSLNSVKRLNNDAAAKAEAWTDDFGRRQVVPTAVVGGVYDLHNLEDAQKRGLTIFWAHDLAPLTEWIAKTKK